jgi:hypothetical protein
MRLISEEEETAHVVFKNLSRSLQRRYDMNGRSQMQGGKHWILPKEINANRFF